MIVLSRCHAALQAYRMPTDNAPFFRSYQKLRSLLVNCGLSNVRQIAYSRSASVGSIDMARLPGIRQANNATPDSTPTADRYVAGSAGPTP